MARTISSDVWTPAFAGEAGRETRWLNSALPDGKVESTFPDIARYDFGLGAAGAGAGAAVAGSSFRRSSRRWLISQP